MTLRGLQKALLVAIFVLLSSVADAGEDVGSLAIGETFAIDSKILGESRRINVYLSPGYKANPSGRFPVLYMPDGGIAEDFLHIAGLVQVSAGNGTIRPFIVVGIENTQRRRDLTGPTQSEDDRKIAPRVGGSESFRSFIREELMPAVERRYRTSRETAVVGESLAGLFVVETLLLEPDLFDTYIAVDPSLWWDGGRLIREAGARLHARPGSKKTLFLASGSEVSIANASERLAEILAKEAPSSLHWHHEKMPEEKHSTIFHPAALKAFRAVFRPEADK